MPSRPVQGAVAPNAAGAFLVETDPGNGNGEREVVVLAAAGSATIGSTSGMLNTAPAVLDPNQDGVFTRRQADVSVSGLTTVNGQTASYASADWDASKISCLAVDFNCTALTAAGATFQALLERKGADGNYYILSSTTISATGQKVIDLGPGSLVTIGNTMRLVLLITGGTTPSISFTFAAHGY